MTHADAAAGRRRLTIGEALERRPRVLALIAGLCLALAMPGFDLPLLAIPGLSLLLVLTLSAPTVRAAGWRGWWFGAGFFLLGLYWIGFSFANRDPALAPLAPFAVAALGLGLALLIAAATALARALRLSGAAAALGFAACWGLAELLRGWLFTGFPWNLAAHAVPPGALLSQPAALIGAFGLSAIVVAAAAAPGVFALSGRRAGWGALAVALALAAASAGYGALRGPAPQAAADAPILRVVQPNIAQRDKWRRDLRDAHFSNLVTLSGAPAAGGSRPSLLIWPETATPFDLAADSAARMVVGARSLPPDGVALIGTPRLGADGAVRNSLIAMDSVGEIVATYDKHHLVPFGEYVPFGRWLPFGGLAGSGFTPGPGPSNLSAAGRLFAPLICYEAIFSRHARAGTPPDLLINVTNDAWFGDTPGPRQHLVASAYRSIEQGAPMVRAANTGISAVVDAHGNVIERLDLGARGVIDAAFPARVSPPPVAQAPEIIPFLFMVALLSGAVVVARHT